MICCSCPRKCNIDRQYQTGFCKVNDKIKIARAGLHFWEEPCISGTKGSGTIFFSGCNLNCVFCQNKNISHEVFGQEISENRLSEIFCELIEKGAHNINLVTPTHYIDVLANVLDEDFPVPIVYNSSGYDSVESLKKLEGKIDIYLPDMKYSDKNLAKKYSNAEDYPDIAKAAIKEMYRQIKGSNTTKQAENGVLSSGMIIRHLVLPNAVENTLDVIDFIDEFDKNDVMFSIMSQYTPIGNTEKYPELNRKINQEEYDRVVDYINLCGLDNGYIQNLESATRDYIPDFDLTGV